MVKSVSQELRLAGESLLTAAETLKNAGKGHPASLAHQAGQRAVRVSQSLIA